jgi:hypothetical protein
MTRERIRLEGQRKPNRCSHDGAARSNRRGGCPYFSAGGSQTIAKSVSIVRYLLRKIVPAITRPRPKPTAAPTTPCTAVSRLLSMMELDVEVTAPRQPPVKVRPATAASSAGGEAPDRKGWRTGCAPERPQRTGTKQAASMRRTWHEMSGRLKRPVKLEAVPIGISEVELASSPGRL